MMDRSPLRRAFDFIITKPPAKFALFAIFPRRTRQDDRSDEFRELREYRGRFSEKIMRPGAPSAEMPFVSPGGQRDAVHRPVARLAATGAWGPVLAPPAPEPTEKAVRVGGHSWRVMGLFPAM
jgi:hypothetical protein